MTDGQGQVLRRTSTILAAISGAGGTGVRLVDLASITGIARPTVHRMLQDLIDVGYVRTLPSRRYTLGPVLYVLGLGAPAPITRITELEATAQRLARETGDTVYVSIRESDNMRYLVRADGGFPIRAQIVDVGQVAPIGSTFSGISLLAWESEEYVTEQLMKHGITSSPNVDAQEEIARRRRQVESQIAQVRSIGYCYFRDFVWPGISGLAAPISSRAGRPYMVVALSAVNERLPDHRVVDIANQLLAAANEMSQFTL